MTLNQREAKPRSAQSARVESTFRWEKRRMKRKIEARERRVPLTDDRAQGNWGVGIAAAARPCESTDGWTIARRTPHTSSASPAQRRPGFHVECRKSHQPRHRFFAKTRAADATELCKSHSPKRGILHALNAAMDAILSKCSASMTASSAAAPATRCGPMQILGKLSKSSWFPPSQRRGPPEGQ